MSYLFDTTVSNDPSAMRELADFATKGLPAMVVSGGLGIANTAIALGNMAGLEGKQFNSIETTKDLLGEDVARYYREHETLVDAGGVILSSLVPGGLAVKGMRAGQMALGNAAAREGAGLLTQTASKLLIADNKVNKLTQAIRSGQHSLSTLNNLKFSTAGRALYQNTLEAAAFETAAILTNNQNSIMNPDDLDYISAITSNADTFLFGVAAGTLIGGAFTGFGNWGKLKHAQKLADIDKKKLAATKDVTLIGNTAGDNLVLQYKVYSESVDAVPAGGSGGLAEDAAEANAYLQRADHNIRIDMKNSIMEMTGAKLEAAKKGANDVPTASIHQVVDDLVEIFTDKALGIDTIAQSFGALERVGFVKLASKEGNEKGVKASLADRLLRQEESGRAAVGGLDSALERAYYPIRDSFYKSPKKKASIADTPAVSIRSMTSTVRANINKNPDLATEDMVLGLIGYGNHAELKGLLQTTPFGKAVASDMQALVRQELPEMATLLNHKQLTKLEPLEIARLIEQAGNINNPDVLFQTSIKLFKGLEGSKTASKYPNLSKLANDPVVRERYIENKLYFNTSTRTFTASPVGLIAADVGKITATGKRITYAKGEIGVKESLPFKEVLEGKKDVIDASAYWAKTSLTVKDNTFLASAKAEGAIPTDDFYQLHTTLESFKKYSSNPENPTVDFRVFIEGEKGVKELNFQQAVQHLTKTKQDALIQLAKKNETDNLWSPKDLQNILNVEEAFILRSGIPSEMSDVFGHSNNFLKTTNVEMVYSAQNLERSFSLGQGLAEVQRVTKAKREDLGLATQTYLENQGASSLVNGAPNALTRNADFDPTASITSVSSAQGFVKAQQADTFGEALFQGISKISSYLRQRSIDTTQNVLGKTGRLIKNDASALNELAVINSKLAQGNYGIAQGSVLKQFEEQLSSIYQDQILEGVSYIVPSNFLKMINTNDITKLNINDYLNAFEFNGQTLGMFRIHNNNVANFYHGQASLNSKYVSDRNTLNRFTGDSNDWNEFTIPALLPNLKDLPETAIVYFPEQRKFGGGKGFIAARNSEELRAKIATLQRNFPDAEVRTVGQIEADARKLGDFDYDGALTSNSANVDLRKFGIQWDVLPESNPAMVDGIIDRTISDRVKLDRQYIRQHYLEDFRALEMEDAALGIASSKTKTGDKSQTLSTQQKLINAALGLQNRDEYKLYRSVQEKIADAINIFAQNGVGLTAKLEGAYKNKSSKEIDNTWKEINSYMKEYGMPEVYKEATDYIMSTSKVGRDVANATVSKMNAFTSFLMLRADQVQGMVNALSTPITLMPAIKELRRMVDGELMDGIIAKEAGITVPNTDISFTSDFKVMMESFSEFFSRKDLVQKYSEQGLISRDLQQLLESVDDFSTVAATMDVGKINGFFGKIGSGLTFLSDKSEELVRFAAARAGDKILDKAIEGASAANKAKLESMRFSILNSLVTKVHGNYVAAQRPTLFQGFGGQALGLFQTYQFNLIQMLTRNIEQGDVRNAMRMLGFQSSIFGLQGVPGFQALNQHIGEKTQARTDLYAEANQNFSKGLSDFFLYGAASAITYPLGSGMNFYTRGDLTPRTPILIPTSFNEVPIVSFMGKLAGAVSAAVTQAGYDGLNPSILWQLMAHQGYSRPLSGLGQIMMGEKTTASGTTLIGFDELDAKGLNTALKLMGTSTTEESIALNSFYRAKSYQSARQAELNKLGMGLKTAIRNGSVTSAHDVMQSYMEAGGDGANFDRWYQHQVQSVNESQVYQMRKSLTTPEGRYLQAVLD